MVKMAIDSMTLEAVSANAPHTGLNEGLKKKRKKKGKTPPDWYKIYQLEKALYLRTSWPKYREGKRRVRKSSSTI